MKLREYTPITRDLLGLLQNPVAISTGMMQQGGLAKRVPLGSYHFAILIRYLL